MMRVTDFDGLGEGAVASSIVEPGMQYALYLFHGAGDGKWGAHFVAKPGSYRDTIILKAVPPGTYRLEWIDPAGGTRKGTDDIRWGDGDLRIATPAYAIDVALRMKKRATL
jgi:hypothetical protein